MSGVALHARHHGRSLQEAPLGEAEMELQAEG